MTLTDKVRTIQSSGSRPNVLVIGDLMIDHYIWGAATRLSPEAPVPIVHVKNETNTLGGAGNLAQNLVSLGAVVTLGGVIGNDEAGKQLNTILTAEGINTDTIISAADRPTTVKTRVLAGSQQLVRIDKETTVKLNTDMEDELLGKLSSAINAADMVVLSDYNKGLFSPVLTQRIIAASNAAGKKVIVDPKGLNYEKYKGAFLIKPNKKELAEAAKVETIHTIEDLRLAAETIFLQTGSDYLVVTLSEEGMAILTQNSHVLLPVKATKVFDVTGAGDTVLAAITYFMASGMSIEEACELANHAAAIVIRRLGSATTTIEEIINDLANNNGDRN